MDALGFLKKYWGYESFRFSQEKIIKSVLNNEDVLALMPTGSGKSICYQLPALMREGLTLVISPLLALMREQSNGLRKKNILAEYLHSEQSQREQEILMDNLRYGAVKLLYLSPERLRNKRFLEQIGTLNISFIAVDEAHCISQWGYNFRPAYLEIHRLRERLPRASLLALSASVTAETANDIMEKLHFKKGRLIQSSFQRENISCKVISSENKWRDLLGYLDPSPKSALIYVRSRAKSQELAGRLSDEGFAAAHYHAGLSLQEKKKREESWRNNSTAILVATSAFGMGIDKADVELIVHWELPTCIESYFQEIGRAGRNGKPALGVLLHHPHEAIKIQEYISQEQLSKEEYHKIQECLYDYHHIGPGERPEKPIIFDLLTFEKRYHQKKKKILEFLKHFEQTGRGRLIQKTNLHIRSKRKYPIKTQSLKNDAQGKFLAYFLRNYPKTEGETIELSMEKILKDTDLAQSELLETLNKLQELQYIEYIYQPAFISYLSARPGKSNETQRWREYQLINEQKVKKFQALRSYVYQQKVCRNISLLSYFGEKYAAKCGNCDICQGQKNIDSK